MRSNGTTKRYNLRRLRRLDYTEDINSSDVAKKRHYYTPIPKEVVVDTDGVRRYNWSQFSVQPIPKKQEGVKPKEYTSCRNGTRMPYGGFKDSEIRNLLQNQKGNYLIDVEYDPENDKSTLWLNADPSLYDPEWPLDAWIGSKCNEATAGTDEEYNAKFVVTKRKPNGKKFNYPHIEHEYYVWVELTRDVVWPEEVCVPYGWTAMRRNENGDIVSNGPRNKVGYEAKEYPNKSNSWIIERKVPYEWNDEQVEERNKRAYSHLSGYLAAQKSAKRARK
jgi:hypothetical protein